VSLLLATGPLGQQATGPVGGGGPIAYVGKGTFTMASAVTTLPLALDAGHSIGDLLLAIIAIGDDVAITGPGGWTLIQQLGSDVGVDGQVGAFYRFADGSEGATVDFTVGSAENMAGLCLAYSGVWSVADTSANQRRDAVTFEDYIGTLPTVHNGDWLVFYIATGQTSARTFLPPSGATEIFDYGGVSQQIFAVAHQGPVSVAPPAQSWTPSASGTFVMGPVLLKV